MDITQTVIEAIHSVWEEWSKQKRSFRGERPDMQIAFAHDLAARLPSEFEVRREAKVAAPNGFSAWRMYDVGVFKGERPVGLVELSYGDTNVPHSLHNGELKLLAACEAIGVTSGRPYSVERGLSREGIESLYKTLGDLAVRGLFFVNKGPRLVLDVVDKAMWWETKAKGFDGETRFRSALMSPATEATLRDVFQKLASRGVSSWFYSLSGEGSVEYLPTNT